MTETTLSSVVVSLPSRRGVRRSAVGGILAGLVTRLVVAPLHRALDSGLRAGDLRGLDAGTLADIGYRRD